MSDIEYFSFIYDPFLTVQQVCPRPKGYLFILRPLFVPGVGDDINNGSSYSSSNLIRTVEFTKNRTLYNLYFIDYVTSTVILRPGLFSNLFLITTT